MYTVCTKCLLRPRIVCVFACEHVRVCRNSSYIYLICGLAFHSQLQPKNIKWKIPELNSCVLNCTLCLADVLVTFYGHGKTLTKSDLRRKGLRFYVTVHHWEKPTQELKQRPWNAIIGLLLWLAQLPSLHNAGPPAQGWHCPEWVGPSYIN